MAINEMNINIQLCKYGCGKVGIKQFKNGEWCCSEHRQSCPVNREKYSKGTSGEKNGFYGRKHSQESKMKMSKKLKGKPGLKGEKNFMYGKRGKLSPIYGIKRSKESTEKANKTRYERYYSDPEWSKKHREKQKIVMNMPEVRERLRKAQLKNWEDPESYWNKTDDFQEKARQRMLNGGAHYVNSYQNFCRGKDNPRYGIPISENQKRKQSLIMKEKFLDEKYMEDHKKRMKIAMNNEETKKLLSGKQKEAWKRKTPEERRIYSERSRQYMLNGGAVYANSFVKNPSRPQVELFKLTKKLYPEAKLNYPIFEVNKSIDVCIPHLKIALEYDGSYWHQDEFYDKVRQKEIEILGYKFIRYKDRVPSLKELAEDIENLRRQ